MARSFDQLLTGGHPNSLGRTEEVVELVLAEPDRLEELFGCYGSDDEVVRLRVSSAMKRLAAARHDLLVPHLDRFLDEVGQLDQASAQWTLAELFDRYVDDLDDDQHAAALDLMRRNLAGADDWIVLNRTMDTLAGWARDDPGLREWLGPHLERLASDRRRSVARRAARHRDELART